MTHQRPRDSSSWSCMAQRVVHAGGGDFNRGQVLYFCREAGRKGSRRDLDAHTEGTAVTSDGRSRVARSRGRAFDHEMGRRPRGGGRNLDATQIALLMDLKTATWVAGRTDEVFRWVKPSGRASRRRVVKLSGVRNRGDVVGRR